jgi:hypothetical protein
MDDYKRGLYMQALRELHEEVIRRTFQTESEYRETFLCEVLVTQLALESGITDEIWCNFEGDSIYGNSEQILTEFFPEFYALFDGNYWSNYTLPWWTCKTTRERTWWSFLWLEPRIRALDCILSDTY